MDVRGQNVLIVGSKRSGLAAAELLSKEGAIITVMDERELPEEERAPFDALGVPVVKQSPEYVRTADTIVLSPAVPFDMPLFSEPRSRAVPVIGEVELASDYLKGPIIGITGSNGKTTTTALTGFLLNECCIAAQVGGNIGAAVTGMVESSRDDQWNVLELSSFQLETIYRFRAQIAACLNVTPDHLDRHHTFENYADAKARLFETQRLGDLAVLNYEDETCRRFASRTKAEIFWFSSRQKVPAGLWLQGNTIFFNDRPALERSQIRLRGLHNVENAMAASLIARLAGASWDAIAKALPSFPGVEHRLEFVASIDGVDYFNDSKATNVDATQKALEAFEGHLWVILGGKDKDSDYRPLREPLAVKAKAVLLIGAAAAKIESELAGAVKLVQCGTLAAAVRYASARASAGDVVLLAPACASFDQFTSYEHRGKTFKELVSKLAVPDTR